MPIGWHDVKVSEVKTWEDKDFVLVVATDEQGNEGVYFLGYSPDESWKWEKLFKAFGIPESEASQPDRVERLKSLRGAYGRVKLEKAPGKIKMFVKPKDDEESPPPTEEITKDDIPF